MNSTPKKILLSSLLVLFLSTSTPAEMVSVKGDKVNLRASPGTKSNVKWEYGAGFPLKVLRKKGSWVKVKDFEQDTGWVHNSLLEYNPQVIVKVNRNKNKKINIRKGPGTTNNIVGKAYYGVVFKTIGKKSGWIQVKHESGLKGWIKENLLWGY